MTRADHQDKKDETSSESTSSSWSDLDFEGIMQGDLAAWAPVIPKLTSFLKQKFISSDLIKQDAVEIADDCVLKMLQRLAKKGFPDDLKWFRNYARKTAKNDAYERLRKRKKLNEVDIENHIFEIHANESVQHTDSPSCILEQIEKYLVAIKKLRPRSRASIMKKWVLWRYKNPHKTQKQFAKRIGKPEGTVAVELNRARNDLAKKLNIMKGKL